LLVGANLFNPIDVQLFLNDADGFNSVEVDKTAVSRF